MNDLTQGIRFLRRITSRVAGTGLRDERRDWMMLSLGIGSIVSLGVGAAVSAILRSDQAFILISMFSAGIFLPASRLIVAKMWRRQTSVRAYSRDNFEFLEYLKDQYHEELSEIESPLWLSNDDKKRKVSARLEVYMQQRQDTRQRIFEERNRESQVGPNAQSQQQR